MLGRLIKEHKWFKMLDSNEDKELNSYKATFNSSAASTPYVQYGYRA